MRFRDLPITRKLVLITMATTGVTLLLAGAAFTVSDLRTFREHAVNESVSVAYFTGFNTSAKLTLDRPKEAHELLVIALTPLPQMRAAALYKKNGSLFAVYHRKGAEEDIVPDKPGKDGSHFQGDKLVLFQPIIFQGEPIGTIYLLRDMSEMYGRLELYGGIVAVVLLSAAVVALVLSSVLQRLISKPILDLVSTAKAVSEGKDYSVRAAKAGRDEVGILVDGFNEMLAQIQARDMALQASESQYRAMFEVAGVGKAQAEPSSGRLLRVNRKMCEITGYSAQELLGMTFLQLTHPLDRVRDRAASQRLAVGEAAEWAIESRYLRKDGRTVWVNINATLVRDAAGRPQLVIAVIQDINERKRAEEALQETQQRLQAIMDNSPAMIYWKDAQGRYSLVNRQWLELCQVSREQAINRTDQDIFDSETAEILMANDRNVLGARKPLEFEESIPHEDGMRTYMSIKFPIFDSAGNPCAVCGISTDISERKHLEDQIRQGQKMQAVGQLAGGVAHDFNNMLGVIMGHSELAISLLKPEDPLRHELEVIFNTTERAATLTRRLLAFSRKQVLQPKVTDLNVVVTEMEKMLRRVIPEDILLYTALEPQLWQVMVDPSQIEQVLMNLVVNARDAMPKGGKLTVETANVLLDDSYCRSHAEAKPGKHVMLAVTDTGSGMDAATQARLFEPFFTTKEKGKGTGLGLSMVYGIVKQSGGNLHVYSEPGKGSVFRIYLPQAEGTARPAKSSATRVAVLGGDETVLVVEDEAQMQELVQSVLEKHGYKVLSARHGKEALLVSENHQGPIHLLLTDVLMPQMGGPELAERLMPQRPEMRVIFMSGYTDNAAMIGQLLRQGFQYIEKPFTSRDLAKKVRAVLDRGKPGP